jgi:AsmA family protein
MDDLLKAFQAEISQDLDTCEADLEQLRKVPDGPAAIANLHRLFCSIREMSVVLGQRKLAEAASRGVAALEAAQAGEPGAAARAIPIVAGCLAQIRDLLQSIEHSDASEASGRARPSNSQSASDADGYPASTTISAATPSKRSKSDAFDLIGEHDEAALPPLRAGNIPPVPEPKAAEARLAPIEVGPPTLSVSTAAAVAGAAAARAGRRKAHWYRPRNILFASGSSVVAAIAAIVIVLVSADPNEYRGIFEQTMQSATGRNVTIGGVDFALSLNPTVVLEDVTLANIAGGSRPQMVTAKRVEVEMALLPLFHGEYVAKRFVLRGADILLEVDAKGQPNWRFAGGDGNAGTGTAGDAMALPQVGRLTIADSTLSYRDGATGETENFELQRVTAQPSSQAALLDVDIESIVNGQPVTLAGKVGTLGLLDSSSPYPVDLAGAVAGLNTTLKGAIARPLQGRGYALALSASGQSLAGLGSMLAADLPPGGPLQLAARVDDVDGAIRVHDITGMIGKTDLSGEVTIHPGKPHWLIDADLSSHHLDLQDFVAAAPGGDSGLDDPRLFPAKPLPYHWIGKIDITAKLAADQLMRGDTTLQAAALEGAISAGRLTLDSLRFGYAGGQVTMKGTGDVSPAIPGWTLRGSARRLAGGEALHRLIGLSLIGGGQADVDFSLAAGGRSLREIASSLDGNVGVNLVDGHIDNDMMRLVLTGLTQAVAAGDRGAQLRCLTAIFDFTDGLGPSRSFVADTGAAVVVGTGDINLRDETINMLFEPSAKDVSLAAVAVPVRVKGPLADPGVGPDPVGVVTQVPRTAISLADAALGLVDAEAMLQDAPIASCAALPASAATSPDKTAPSTKKPAPAPTQQATATPKKPSKKKPQSTTDQILNQAGAVANSIGSSIRSGVDNVIGGASSSSSSHKSTKTKPDK